MSEPTQPTPISTETKSPEPTHHSVLHRLPLWYTLPLILLTIFLIPALIITILTQRIVSQQTTQVNKSTPTLTPVPLSDPTANWQTYVNDIFGFQMKYPNEYQTAEEKLLSENEMEIIFKHQNYNITPEYYGTSNWEGRKIQLTLVKSPLDLKDYVAKKIGLSELRYGKFEFGELGDGDLETIDEINELVINPNSFIVYHRKGAAGGDWNYLTKGSTNIIADIDYGYRTVFGGEDVLNQILSTFQFLDQNGQSSDWKTHTDNILNLSISYPNKWTINKPTPTRQLLTLANENQKINLSKYSQSPVVGVSLLEWYNNISLEETNYDGAAEILDRKPRTIAGIDGIQLTESFNNQYVVIYLPGSESVLQITVDPAEIIDNQTINQILTTLKFLD